MKRIVAVILAVIMLIFSFSLPSFALVQGDFIYEMDGETAVITAYTGTATSLVIPAKLNGIAVSKIGDSAFKGNSALISVTVSAGVESIGTSAFENCTSLATITLPTTITHIGEKAIYNTAYYNKESNWKKPQPDSSSGNIGFGNGMGQIPWEDIAAQDLEYLYLGTNLIEISFSGSYSLKKGTRVIADGAFAGCDAERVTLSNTLVAIGENAFKDCKSLKEVKFNENIEVIGDYAFDGCTSLETISLPDKYIEMSSTSFYNTGFYNNSDNWDNNALYNENALIDIRENIDIIEIKDGTKYIVGDSLGENDAFIPETVLKISDKAFADSSMVTIFGYADTYAHNFATTNNIYFVDMGNLTKGDVNLDGKIDRDDYNILCDISVTQRIPNLIEKIAGDMDDDGTVDSIDVIILDLMLNDMPPSRLKGDVNGDNKVDIDDYDLLVNIVSTNEKITDNVMFQRADINEDGSVDAFDAVYLDLALNGIVALI